MADNFVSYSRFTALPPNIAEHGVTVEEIRLQRGTPNRNPLASPMPSTRLSRIRLALRPGGSDALRVGEAAAPPVDPYEGPQSELVLTRVALRKLDSGLLTDLEGQVQLQTGLPADTRSLMLDSFRRVGALKAYLGELQSMREIIYVRCVAASKG